MKKFLRDLGFCARTYGTQEILSCTIYAAALTEMEACQMLHYIMDIERLSSVDSIMNFKHGLAL